MSDAYLGEALLEQPPSYEEERGKPMPSTNHSFIQANLIVEFAKHPKFRVFSELEIELGGKSYVPDISLYRREPANLLHDLVRRLDPPLVTVEILSPSQGYGSIATKVEAYFQHGVGSCWIVTPLIHNVTIMTPGGGRLSFSDGVATDPGIGVTADLAAMFS